MVKLPSALIRVVFMPKLLKKNQKSLFINAIKFSFNIWLNDKVKNEDLDALDRFNEFLKNEKLRKECVNNGSNRK